MNVTKPRHAPTRIPLLVLVFLASLSSGPAQPAPMRAAAPADLAKYDKNRNGLLDTDELAAMEANRNKPVPVVVTPSNAASDATIVLSPFEIVAESRGYQALNSLSGTRFNTKLEDLGSSIEVVTKEQMSDFAKLDINDVFLYAGNTEGTGTYSDYSATNAGTGSTDDMTMRTRITPIAFAGSAALPRHLSASQLPNRSSVFWS